MGRKDYLLLNPLIQKSATPLQMALQMLQKMEESKHKYFQNECYFFPQLLEQKAKVDEVQGYL